MATSFVDFTDLFRILADIEFTDEKNVDSKKLIVEKILDACANSIFINKKNISKYSAV